MKQTEEYRPTVIADYQPSRQQELASLDKPVVRLVGESHTKHKEKVPQLDLSIIVTPNVPQSKINNQPRAEDQTHV